MSVKKMLLGVVAVASAPLVMAGTPVQLGTPVALSAIEGGLLTLAVAGLVAGVRIVQAKRKKGQGR